MDPKQEYQELDSLLRRIANKRAAAGLRSDLREDLRDRYARPFMALDADGRRAFMRTVTRWAECLGD